MADAPDLKDQEPFSEEGKAARETIRFKLNESAVALQRERLEAERDASEAALKKRIAMLGFEGDAQRVFDLLPLVHVAWADGKIQSGERGTILDLVRIRGIAAGEAYLTMAALLEKRPSDAYLEESLEVLREVLDREDRPEAKKTVVGLCILVAEAAGGLLGLFDPVSKQERAVIEKIAKRLGDDAYAEFQRRLG